jgi:phosphoenolpyruvate carboxykinase (GTP)
MAMLPFIGYHAGDYFRHWIELGKGADADRLPKVFYVNWFRRDADDRFLWPGFGENGRVLKWDVERLEGSAAAVETPIGHVPTPESLDTTGLDLDPADLAAALRVDPAEWRAEVASVAEWFASTGPAGTARGRPGCCVSSPNSRAYGRGTSRPRSGASDWPSRRTYASSRS